MKTTLGSHRSWSDRSKVLGMGLIAAGLIAGSAHAGTINFDFDNAPAYTSLPVDVAAGGVTAHLTATAQGFSIQNANVLGFTPVGFAGHSIYPNSVFAADLKIAFTTSLSDFSIQYAPEEYDCDSSATMRVTAYLGGVYVGTNTATTYAGTWPTGTLAIHTTSPFDNVVVHYDSPPPTGGDWGPIFMADNMVVKTYSNSAWSNYGAGWPGKNGIPALTMSANPVLCATPNLHIGNSTNVAAPSMLFLGLSQVDLPTGYAGHLLVSPFTSMALTVPGAGVDLPLAIPCDNALNGVVVYLQVLESDALASKGVSFTKGLKLTLGT